MNTRDFTHWLIHRAALSAPTSLSERLEEEWLADLAARTSALSRLLFALGCCWATRVIVHELGVSIVPVGSSAGGETATLGYLHNDTGFSSRRSMTFVLVVGVHIAVFIGLMTNIKIHRAATPVPFQTTALPPPQTHPLPSSLPPPPVTKTRIVVPEPEFPSLNDDAKVADAETPPVGPLMSNDPNTEPPPHVATHVQGGPGIGFPTADDYYPSAAKRLEEQGVSTVRVCVDAKGRLTSDPATVQSSGSARLDQGALQLAKAGSGRYRPSTEDGRPVESCYPFRVRFELRK